MKYFQNGLNQICKQIIRPSRAEYSLQDLTNYQSQDEISYSRQDFDLQNSHNETIRASLYKSHNSTNVCIVYLHTANGSRMEVAKYVNLILKNGFSFISFDFSGSGISDGNIVTYGFKEIDDLNVVLQHFQLQFKQFILWGRSMGSVIAIQYMEKYNFQQIKGLILDSPFVSLLDIIISMASQRTKLPNFILKGLSTFVSRELKQQAGFELEDINCISKIHLIKCPAIFITSKKDTVVPAEQTEKLFKNYGGIKQIFHLNSEHNSIRDNEFILTLIQWFKKRTPIFQRIGVGTQIKEKIIHKQKSINPTVKQISLDLYKERSINSEYVGTVNTCTSPRIPTPEEKYNKLLETQRSLYFNRSSSAQRMNHSLDYQIFLPQSHKHLSNQQNFNHFQPIHFTKVPHKTKECS